MKLLAGLISLFIIRGISADEPLKAVRVYEKPQIDGLLNEEVWNSAVPVSSGFVQHRPDCGEEMSEKTEIRVIYDSSHIYFYLRMFDSRPEEFRHVIAPRDEDFSSEWIGIWLDTFNDDNNAYFFYTNVDNVQQDGRLSEIGGWDSNWDGVWESATTVTDSSWNAEIAIPFSILRYSGRSRQAWGINFKRTMTRTNESGFLFRMADNGHIEIENFGTLLGLDSLPSSSQIDFRPYGAARLRYKPEAEEEWDPWANGGLDSRIGLSSELILDLTVNPDFGQVEADADQANLSHWETYLSEKRPFFLEGSDLFEMPFSLFYSRRIGAVAPNGDIIPILGGAKLTGSAGGFRIGFLDAYTGEITEDGETLTGRANYWAGRLVREFGRGTYLGLSGTSMDSPSNDISSYSYGRAAALDGQVTFLEDHELSGALGGTWNSYDQEWRDNLAYRAKYSYENHRLDLACGFNTKEENFDANAVGYTSSTGAVNSWIYGGLYTPLDESETIQNVWSNLNLWYDKVPGGDVTGRGISFNTGAMLSNRYHVGLDIGYDGSWTDRYEGPQGTEYEGGWNFEVSSSTDYRKPLHGSVWGGINSYRDGSYLFAGTWLCYKPTPSTSIEADIDYTKTWDTRKYSWSSSRWSSRDTDWRSLQMSLNWMFSNDLSVRLTSQVSRFSTSWDTGEEWRELSHWMNCLLSWRFQPGSMFYFMVGENADPDPVTGDFEEPEYTIYSKVTWFLPV